MRKTIASAEVLLFFIAISVAILPGNGNDYQPRDVTENRMFGCHWLGGNTGSALNCTCFTSDVELLDIQDGSIPDFNLNAIIINDCPKVNFGRNAIRRMRTLRHVNLRNIASLTFEENSLHWDGYTNANDMNTPTVRVAITNCTVPHMSSYTFMGRISEITLERVRIVNMFPYAFSSLVQCQHIGFRDVEVNDVQSQAFKKFSLDSFTIHSSKFDYLPSRSFSDLIVTDSLLVSNSNFTNVRSGAFLVFNPRRFEVTNTNFTSIDAEAFRVTTRGDVLFRNCDFGAARDGVFVGFDLNLREVPFRKVISLENLRFREITTRTFRHNATSFDMKMTNVSIGERCDCRRATTLSNFYQLRDFYCASGDDMVNYQEFRDGDCSMLASNATIVIVTCTALGLLIVIGLVLWCYFKKAYRCDQYGGKEPKKKKLGMIVPDGRTYRETELHVIVERTDLLTTDL